MTTYEKLKTYYPQILEGISELTKKVMMYKDDSEVEEDINKSPASEIINKYLYVNKAHKYTEYVIGLYNLLRNIPEEGTAGRGVKLYRRDDGEIILELWAASTKHPDSMFRFSDFSTVEYLPKPTQLYQWILECASKLTLPMHALDLANFAGDVYNAIIEQDGNPARHNEHIDESILAWTREEFNKEDSLTDVAAKAASKM